MIDLLVSYGTDAVREAELLCAIEAREAAVLASAGRGEGRHVGEAEAVVRADPAGAFSFDAGGNATLTVAGRTWAAGRFEPVSLSVLRARAAERARSGSARLRLWVLDGANPNTDIGSLQGHADGDTLFQVASQFNCLESGGPWVRPVEGYFNDPTQGPRASISAFAGTLLRHYCAPAEDGGRFVQVSDGRQIELLADVCSPDLAMVRNGYLLPEDVSDPEEFLKVLEARFDAIRVGVHDELDAVLGYDWDGAVPKPPRISQVFTSTVAAGYYGDVGGAVVDLCRQLLRAAYLGTLMAAAGLGRGRVVLTLIGGGAFGNPPRLIWESIKWALAEVEPLLSRDLDVVVNGRNLGKYIDAETLARAARERGGVLLAWPQTGRGRIYR
jgi:hypothetical protein